ncbi:uncharacterized protein B0H64DRAFT_6402 [Chaetomium fimeti]|uniref:Uncharacterized protein n=1 Tax=Chaetomium fimeti TaxID=1854472 RepID=A0AAE0HQS7_9PEZI|nr:hypothetical protein B0H64DRAFT_6402 [Chaetomium fimeti]
MDPVKAIRHSTPGSLLPQSSTVPRAIPVPSRPHHLLSSIISLALSRLPQPPIRPLLVLHPLGHRLVHRLAILQSPVFFFLVPVSIPLFLTSPDADTQKPCVLGPFPIDLAPISRPAPPPVTVRSSFFLFATPACFPRENAYARFQQRAVQLAS